MVSSIQWNVEVYHSFEKHRDLLFLSIALCIELIMTNSSFVRSLSWSRFRTNSVCSVSTYIF